MTARHLRHLPVAGDAGLLAVADITDVCLVRRDTHWDSDETRAPLRSAGMIREAPARAVLSWFRGGCHQRCHAAPPAFQSGASRARTLCAYRCGRGGALPGAGLPAVVRGGHFAAGGAWSSRLCGAGSRNPAYSARWSLPASQRADAARTAGCRQARAARAAECATGPWRPETRQAPAAPRGCRPAARTARTEGQAGRRTGRQRAAQRAARRAAGSGRRYSPRVPCSTGCLTRYGSRSPGPAGPGCRIAGEFLHEQHVRALTAHQPGSHPGHGPATARPASRLAVRTRSTGPAAGRWRPSQPGPRRPAAPR